MKKVCNGVRRTLARFYISVLQGERRSPPSLAFPPWSTQLDLRKLAFLALGTELFRVTAWSPSLLLTPGSSSL